MNITATALRHQRDALSDDARDAIRVAVEPAPHVDEALLLALGSRETNLRNIVGDGGHGRGMWQADDRWQEHYLRSTRGCDSGTSTPRYDSAWPKGRVPTISSGARFATHTLEANVAEAKRRGVRDGDRLFVAVAGYNRGITGAINAYHDGGGRRAVDAGTAHGDYATDVLERAEYFRDH